LRGFLGFFGVMGLYYPLIYLSVSDVIVIQFLSPTVTALFASWFLKERFTKLEGFGGLISLIGVLLIAKPAFLFGPNETHLDKNVESSDPNKRILAVIMSLIGLNCGAGSFVTIRFIGQRANAVILVSYFALISTILSFICIVMSPTLTFKVPQTTKQWGLFIVIGVTGFFMQFLMTAGMQYEKASRAASMMYTQIVFGIIWEYIIWHHLPNLWSWIGTFIILSTSFCVFYFKKSEIDEIPHRIIDEEEDLNNSVLESHNKDDFQMQDFEIEEDGESK